MQTQTEELPTSIGITQTQIIELCDEDCQTEGVD